MDGTEALDGMDTAAPHAPAQPAAPQPAGDAPEVSTAVAPGMQGNGPQLPAPQAPQATRVSERRGGVLGLLDAVGDLLDNPKQTHSARDANGNLYQVRDNDKTHGQQWREIVGEAIQGAATAAGAPPGPNHVGQGVAAAVNQQFGQQREAQARDTEQADRNFTIQQRARQDNLNYQIGIRNLAASSFELARRQVQAGQQDVQFSQQQEEHEKQLGSFDLGVIPGAMDLHQVQQKQPDFFKKLHQGLVTAVPVFNADGTHAGIHVYERRPDVMAQRAPAGIQVPVWNPPTAPGGQPTTTMITPTDASNADIERYRATYWDKTMAYQKQMTDAAEGAAKVQLTKAQAVEAGARAVEARAGAAKDMATARKTSIEAQQLTGGGGDTTPNESNAEAMVDGRAAPSQFSKRARDFNAMLPLANAYSLKKYGVPFDQEVSEGRYRARVKTIEGFASGKEGDQMQTYNQFLAHAGDLARTIDTLRNSNVKIINTPLKDLRKALGDDRYHAIEPLIVAVRTEHANFLNNNHALHEQDIQDNQEMLSDTDTLAQAEKAIKQFASTATRRAGALNNRYRRVVGTGDVPGILDPLSRETIKQLGLEQEAQQSLGTAWTQPQEVPQQATTPPRPGGAPAPQQPQTNRPAAPAGGTVVSLAQAMQLPQNKGKTADQVRQDITAHGHKVGE